MSQSKYVHFKEVCQASGLKATSQRFLIYKTLAESTKHPTADQLFDMVADELPGLSRDTIFRTLAILVDCGLAKKLSMPGGATHYDGDMSQHHHFLCEKCDKIYDFSSADLNIPPWPPEVLEVGWPRQASILISGLCRSCSPDNGDLKTIN